MAARGYEFYLRVLKASFTSERSERVRDTFNLVHRVLGLFGQRVSARRDSGIIDSIFPENVGSGLITYA